MGRTLEQLAFDNRYAALPPVFWERVDPTPLPNLRVGSVNEAAAELLELDPAELRRPDFAEFWGGHKRLEGMLPVAMRYAGHQFGSFVPQLGDGRAILLGTVRTGAGALWDLHLKGSGPTPFARGFDGRAVLRSSIREYLCSEALHHLGIPTTRALCLTVSDAPVRREKLEPAATIVRMAPSHVRIGSFEYFTYAGQTEWLAPLADFVIANFFPHLVGLPDRHVRFLGEVIERTARLMAMWQSVGWTHGVMNTDNFSILGLTIDYGPFGFLDAYDANFIPNHSDPGGRYAYDQQPGIGHWNCVALAQALLPLMTREEAIAQLDRYAPAFEDEYGTRLRAKLGLATARDDDAALVQELFRLMQEARADFTNTFRGLCDMTLADAAPGTPAAGPRLGFGDPRGFDAWAATWRARLAAEGSVDAERQARMRRANPRLVLRNWIAQRAIEKAEAGDFTEVDRVLALLRRPFDEQPGDAEYAAEPPDWARSLVLSCSS